MSLLALGLGTDVVSTLASVSRLHILLAAALWALLDLYDATFREDLLA